MSSPADSHEKTILESKGILIHDQIFHAVLTDRRIILTRYSDNKLSIRSIYLADIQKIEQDTDDDGDPVIIVVTPSATRELKTAVLLFSPENFPDPHKESSLWASKINSLKQPAVPFSLDDITKKDPSTPVLCGSCGNTVAAGSVFCNVCGTKIINPVQQNLPEQGEESVQDEIIASEILTGEREPAPEPVPEKISVPDGDDSGTGENVPVMEPLPKEQEKKESFFTRSGSRKPAVIAISALVVIILLIGAFFVLIPSGSHGFDLTSIGMNSTNPEVKATSSASQPLAKTTTIPKTTELQATPEQPTPTEVLFTKPTLVSVPGDPASVLVSYPALFNAADGAGLSAILSENMKLYSTEVDRELAMAQSNGYVIEKIQVTNQVIEEDSAILDVDILWKVAGSPATSSPKFYLVYENDQWKLDSLVVSPNVS
jgi:hypothetical protein